MRRAGQGPARLVAYAGEGVHNAARKAAFRPTYPVSTLVEVSGLVFPDLLVEIDAFANLDLSLQQD